MPEEPVTPKKRDRGVQPKTHAPKNKVAKALRRKKLLTGIAAGLTLQQAGIEAGFSPKTAASQVSQNLNNPKVIETLCSVMEKIGITNNYLADQHRQLIEGTKVISANIIVPGSADLKEADFMTKDFIEVPDFQAKAKGLDMTYRLRGLYQDKLRVDGNAQITVTTGIPRDNGDNPR